MRGVYKYENNKYRVYVTHEQKMFSGGEYDTEEEAKQAAKELKKKLGVADISTPISKQLRALPIGKRTLFKSSVEDALTLRRSIVYSLTQLDIKASVVSSKKGVYVTITA